MTWTTTGEIVTAAKLNEVFPAGDDAYTTWTPIYTNLTVGNGTVVARYNQIGQTVFAEYSLTFGSTTSIAGDVQISTPVTGASPGSELTVGVATLFDSGSTAHVGIVEMLGTTFRPRATIVSGTSIVRTSLTSTVPMTWTTNDQLNFTAVYEAA